MEAPLRLLSHHNLKRLFDEVGTLYQPVHPKHLPLHFINTLKRLIPGDLYALKIVLPPNRNHHSVGGYVTLTPRPSNWDTLAERFTKLYSDFPLSTIRESEKFRRVLVLSDMASRAELERFDFYHNFYRELSVADDLSVGFRSLNHQVCVAILRGRRGFSTQDRTILAAIHPHLERAYGYAHASEAVDARAEPLRHPLGSLSDLEDVNTGPSALAVLGLSARESEVLYWVAAGKSSPVISTILGIGHDTVRSHLRKIFVKLGVENRLSAALRALQVLRAAKLR